MYITSPKYIHSMTSIIRDLKADKATTALTLFLIVSLTSIIIAFASLPPEAYIVRTVNSQVESKDAYLRLTMFVPMGDNLTGIPMLDVVYQITTVNGEQVQISRDQYDALDQGDQVVINYWVRGWLDGKTIANL